MQNKYEVLLRNTKEILMNTKEIIRNTNKYN